MKGRKNRPEWNDRCCVKEAGETLPNCDFSATTEARRAATDADMCADAGGEWMEGYQGPCLQGSKADFSYGKPTDPVIATKLLRSTCEGTGNGVWLPAVETGSFEIDPDGTGTPFEVLCDFDTPEGPWTVIQQRRADDAADKAGSIFGKKNFATYEEAFGEIASDKSHWIGLKNMHRLTKKTPMLLVVDVTREDNGQRATSTYSDFRVDAGTGYHLRFDKFLGGGAGDSLGYHKNRKFSTYDRDQDSWRHNCGSRFTGGWWYGSCHHSNLNGQLGSRSYGQGANWYHYGGHRRSVKHVTMRVKHSGGSIDKFKLGSDTSLGATPEGVVAWSCFKKGTSDNNVAADCGFRTSDGASAVVTAKSSFTVMGWIHKRGSIPGHQWWHVFTDGHSGDLLTVRGRHGGNFEATMNSGGWGGSFEAGGFNGHKWSGPSSKHNFNALSDNAWHSLAVRYEKDKRTLTLFVDGEKGQVRRNVKINPAFKLRNFFGWGSRNSNYKYEGWFGSVLVHRTALDDGQITHNHYATAPAHMAGAKAPIRMRVFADSTTKARSGLSLGPAWLSSTSIKFVTTKLDRKPSWRMGGGGFDQHGMPDSWQVLGPFSNGASCTLDGGLGKTSEKIPDGSKIGAAAPAPGEDDTTSGKKWDLYKFNFAARMQSFCDTCNDHRGVDLTATGVVPQRATVWVSL
jgi:hypothetical protein